MNDTIYVPKSDILDLITEENEAGGSTDYSNYSNLWDEVDDMPAADVQPVKHGWWIWDNSPEFGNPYGSYKCSECEERQSFKENYCPNCGAKMDGGDE